MKSILKRISKALMSAFVFGLWMTLSKTFNLVQVFDHFVDTYHHEILFAFLGCIFLSRIKNYCQNSHRCNCDCNN